MKALIEKYKARIEELTNEHNSLLREIRNNN